MPRTALTVKSTLGSYPGVIAAEGADVTWEAADVSNKNQFKLTGKELVLVRNDNVAAKTVTITSVNDTFKRTQDIAAYSVGIGEYAMFGPFEITGWQQTDGNLYLEGSDVLIKFLIVKLP